MKSLVKRLAIGATVAAVTAPVLVGCGSDGASPGDRSLTVSVGRQPFAAGNSPITEYMKQHSLFEKAAERRGYDLTVDYRDYPSAAPQVEALVGGRLDFGMWGDTPVIRGLAQRQPLTVISVGEGHLRFILATHEGSGITSLEDLRGKRVGLLIGGDPQLAFVGMLKYGLGDGDPAAHDINLVNLPTQAGAASVPKGVDATVVGYPALLKQQEKPDNDVVGVVNSYGTTEPGYEGPLGSGAGHALAGAAESPFAPEGVYGHRSMWVVRNAVLEDHPDVISAFVAAEQEAMDALAEMPRAEVSHLVQQYWDLDAENGAKIVEDELVFRRGWIWATEGDAAVLHELSVLMAANEIIPSEVSWDDVKAGFEKGAAAVEAGYQDAGSQPGAEQFEPTEDDVRGPPSWNLDEWTEPGSGGGRG